MEESVVLGNKIRSLMCLLWFQSLYVLEGDMFAQFGCPGKDKKYMTRALLVIYPANAWPKSVFS